MQFMTATYEQAEKVFIVAENNEGAELTPGQVVEWSVTTSADDRGRLVELVDAAVNNTTGIGGHKVAGVVESTIATSEVGRLQIYGPMAVDAVSTVDSALMVLATTGGAVTTATLTSNSSPHLNAAIVGWTLADATTTAEALVQVSIW